MKDWRNLLIGALILLLTWAVFFRKQNRIVITANDYNRLVLENNKIAVTYQNQQNLIKQFTADIKVADSTGTLRPILQKYGIR